MRRSIASTAILAGLLALAATAQTPRPAPELQFVSHTGQQLKLSGYRGKVVVVEFLLTHCATCKANARLLTRLLREYEPKGLQVIGLAIDEGAGPKIPDFIRETGSNFPIGVYDNEKSREFLQFSTMKRMMMPQIAVVDRKGQIREQHGADEPWLAPAIEETNLRKLFDKLLAEPAGAAPRKK